MTAKTKTILKKILAYALMSVVLMLVYAVVSFLFDWLFDLIGEEKVSWRSMVAACTFTTAAIIIVDILNSRKKGVDRSDDIIKICRRILTTTIMFCGSLVIEWLIQRFSDEDFSLGLVHWLSFALAVALFDELIKKNQEKKRQEDAMSVWNHISSTIRWILEEISSYSISMTVRWWDMEENLRMLTYASKENISTSKLKPHYTTGQLRHGRTEQ